MHNFACIVTMSHMQSCVSRVRLQEAAIATYCDKWGPVDSNESKLSGIRLRGGRLWSTVPTALQYTGASHEGQPLRQRQRTAFRRTSVPELPELYLNLVRRTPCYVTVAGGVCPYQMPPNTDEKACKDIGIPYRPFLFGVAAMPIDIQSESLLSLPKAAQLYDVHLSTVHRWRLRGNLGVKLETVRIGGKRLTSHEALNRFHERVTAAADGETVPRSESNTARKKQLDKVDAELAAAGI